MFPGLPSNATGKEDSHAGREHTGRATDATEGPLRQRLPQTHSIRLEIPAVAKPVLIRAQYSLNELQERCGSLGAAGALGKYLCLAVTRLQFAHRCRVQYRALLEQLQPTR